MRIEADLETFIQEIILQRLAWKSLYRESLFC